MNSSQQTANNTIDLHRLMVLCRKHIKMLIIWTLLAGVLGYVVAQFVVVPKYTATTEILVNQKHESNDNGCSIKFSKQPTPLNFKAYLVIKSKPNSW